MKRYITLLLSAVMMFQMSVCVHAEDMNWNEFAVGSTSAVTGNILPADSDTESDSDITAEETDYNYKKLKALGIASDSADSTVTRAEYVAMAMRALGADNTYDRQIFLDVPKNHWAAGYINAAYELGIISGSNGLYEPDKAISYADAVVISVRLLGRNDAAEALGGYPGGYIAAAQKYKLLTGVDSENASPLYVLMSNTVESTNLAVLDGFKDGEGVYSTDKSRNILSYYRDIYSYEGIVSAVGPSSIYTSSLGEADTVKIGEEKFVGTYADCIEYLGMECEVLYKEIDGKNQIIFIDNDGYNKVISLNAEDIDSFSANKYTYYENNKKRYASISADASVVYNGRIATSGIKNMYTPGNGSVTLIDNDGNSNYDVVIIKNVLDIVVGTVVTEDDETVVYDYYDKNNFVKFNFSDSDTVVNLINTDGKTTYPAMLMQRSILSVSTSTDGTVVSGIHSVNSTSGVIGSVSKNNLGTVVEINGIEYTVTDECEENCSKLIVSGASVTLSLNAYGRVADICEYSGNSDGLNYAYVIGVDESGALATDIKLKILNYDGEIVIKTLDSKCRIDGENYSSSSKQLEALNRGLAYGEVIRYQLNSDDLINRIDTLYFNSSKEEEKTTLRKIFDAVPSGSDYRYKSETRKGNFGEKFFWDAQYTTVFLVYENETVDRKKYRVPTVSFPWLNDSTHIPDAYSHTDTFYANAIVDKIESSSDNIADRTLYILEGVSSVPSDYYETVSLRLNSGKGTVSVSMEKAEFEKRNIEPGDIISCDYADGEIIGENIQKMYDYSDNEVLEAHDHWVNDILFIRKGFIYDKKDSMYSIYATDNIDDLANPDESKIFVNKPASTFIMYEKDGRGNVLVNTASTADLKPYLGCGNDCSEVIIRYQYMSPQQVIIVK